MLESDIVHANGNYWVGRERRSYVVYFKDGAHPTRVSEHKRDWAGLSNAIRRCDELAEAVT